MCGSQSVLKCEQSSELMAKYGVSVPKGGAAATAEEAEALAKRYGQKCVSLAL